MQDSARRVLLIDHYDSFTYTIKAYFEILHAAVEVVQYDDNVMEKLAFFQPDYLVFSPGPGHPRDMQLTQTLIHRYQGIYPMLGICLGMQCMAEAFGGVVSRAPHVMHGKQSFISHTGEGLYAGIPTPFSATRYHSLIVESASLPDCMQVNAWTESVEGPQLIMGIKHRNYPIWGVQYHPEAILSEFGEKILANFLNDTCVLRSWWSM